MKTQIIGRFILAFVLMTTALSTAQIVEIDTSTIPDEVTFPHEVTIDSLAFEIPGFAPRGIFTIPGGSWNDPPRPKAWKDSCLDGVTIRTYWRDLNPAEGVEGYDWKELDMMFKKAKDHGKLIHLMVAPGFYSPEWVLDQVETRKFTVPGGKAPLQGELQRLPLPWNRKYLDLWFAFVDTLAARYGPDSALSVVAVTGPNGHNGEVNLPDSKQEDINTWITLTGSEDNLKDKVVTAYKETLDHFHKVFAKKHAKYFSLQIFDRSLPIAITPQNKIIQDAYQEELIEYARRLENPKKKFILMNGGLDAWPWVGVISEKYPVRKKEPDYEPPQWKRIQKYADRGFITGFQARSPLARTGDEAFETERGTALSRHYFRQILRNSIRFNAGFLELYEADFFDANLSDLIPSGSVLLRGKCPCGNF